MKQSHALVRDVNFWRSPLCPGVELRHASYRRQTFHRHSHPTYSLGIVVRGVTEFVYRGQRQRALKRVIWCSSRRTECTIAAPLATSRWPTGCSTSKPPCWVRIKPVSTGPCTGILHCSPSGYIRRWGYGSGVTHRMLHWLRPGARISARFGNRLGKPGPAQQSRVQLARGRLASRSQHPGCARCDGSCGRI